MDAGAEGTALAAVLAAVLAASLILSETSLGIDFSTKLKKLVAALLSCACAWSATSCACFFASSASFGNLTSLISKEGSFCVPVWATLGLGGGGGGVCSCPGSLPA